MPIVNYKSALAATNLVASYEPCSLKAIRENWNGAADAFIQIHDAKSLPADAAVPVRSLRVHAGAGFEWAFSEEIVLTHGCVICFSSTSATKTIVTGSGNTGDIIAEGCDLASVAVGTYVGDLTTGLDALTVWADANGPKKLARLEFVSSSASDAYALIFPYDSPAASAVPIVSLYVVKSATTVYDFGDGFVPLAKTAAGVTQDACQVYMSEDADVLSASHQHRVRYSRDVQMKKLLCL